MNQRSRVALVLGTCVCVAACSSDTPSGTRTAPNTGSTPDGSSPSGTGGRGLAGSGGVQSGGARTNGSGGRVGVPDASLVDSSAGGGGAGGSAGIPATPGVDAGPTPPAHCVPGCIWDVVKHCLPIMRTCVEQVDGLGTTTCDPDTGWSTVVTPPMSLVMRSTFSVLQRGAMCFEWDHYGSLGMDTLSDASGNNVAVRSGNNVYCGVGLSGLTGIAGNQTDAGLVAPDGQVLLPAEHMNRSLPECAAWDDHGLPVRPGCETTVTGTCP